METVELFYPQVDVRVGAYVFAKGIEIEAHSSKNSYFDWARVRFTPEFQPQISLERKAPAQIALGYAGVFDPVFKGYLTQPYNSGGSTHEITLKDDMIRVEEAKVSGTFLDTTPQELLTYFLGKAGVTGAQLSAQAYPPKARVVLREMTVIKAIEEVHALWGIKPAFFFSGGVFHWGTKPKQEKVYRFEYGVNILALNRIGGMWDLETVSAPFVKHSHLVEVAHPDSSGTFEVSAVVFTTNDAGFIRTHIYY